MAGFWFSPVQGRRSADEQVLQIAPVVMMGFLLYRHGNHIYYPWQLVKNKQQILYRGDRKDDLYPFTG